jgi:hypothetical protein
MTFRPKKKSLYDAYYFPGFTPVRELKGVFGDAKGKVIRLHRRSKKQSAGLVARAIVVGMTSVPGRLATWAAGTSESTWNSIFAGSIAKGARL